MNTKNENEDKILISLKNNLKVHIILKDNSWRNGYVIETSPDFFMFEDKENGIEPIFFLDLEKVEPYSEGKR